MCVVAFLLIVPMAVFADGPVIEMNNMPPPQIALFYPEGSISVGTKVTIKVIIPKRWHINANIAADEF